MKKDDALDQQARRDFLERRRKCIGGSDAPALCGADQYNTPYQVWLSKIGTAIPDQPMEAAFWGSYLEDPIAQHALEKIREEYPAAQMRRDPRLLVHPEHQFIGGNIDRRLRLDKSGNYAVLEVKTRSAYLVQQWEGSMPDDVYIQAAHYQMVDPRFVGSYVAALIGGNKFVLRWIPRKEDVLKNLTEVEVKFWRTYVEPKIPPPVTASAVDRSLLNYLYGQKSDGTTVHLDQSAEKLIKQYEQARDAIKDLTDKKDEASNRLRQMIGAAECGIINGKVIKLSRFTVNRFSTKAFEEKHPKLYEKFTQPQPQTRLSIRKI
jgi:putative phage-type endonuclease